jgi:(E)-4-hydroxy-3-methylbut-2-enyl-diphosphate synthase
MDENAARAEPRGARGHVQTIVISALESAALAERYRLAHDQIILSAKVSGVQDSLTFTVCSPAIATTRCTWA